MTGDARPSDFDFARLAQVVADTLGIEPARVTPDLEAADVDSWDSLNHLRLITAVEQAFQVRFSMLDIIELQSVGDLAGLVASMTPAA